VSESGSTTAVTASSNLDSNFTTPAVVNISGVGVPGYNTNGQITNTSNCTVTSTVLTSNIATINCSNTIVEGWVVSISGTSNSGGVFNGTWTVSSANAWSFSFNLTHADVALSTDSGTVTGTKFRYVNSNTGLAPSSGGTAIVNPVLLFNAHACYPQE